MSLDLTLGLPCALSDSYLQLFTMINVIEL